MHRFIVVLLGLVLTGPAWADPPAERPAFKLEPVPVEGLAHGKLATLQGTGKPTADQFYLEAVGVLQPVIVTLIPQHRGDVLKLTIGKQRWDETLKEASTDPSGSGPG